MKLLLSIFGIGGVLSMILILVIHCYSLEEHPQPTPEKQPQANAFNLPAITGNGIMDTVLWAKKLAP